MLNVLLFVIQSQAKAMSLSVISMYTEKGKAKIPDSNLHARKAAKKELKMLNL